MTTIEKLLNRTYRFKNQKSRLNDISVDLGFLKMFLKYDLYLKKKTLKRSEYLKKKKALSKSYN